MQMLRHQLPLSYRGELCGKHPCPTNRKVASVTKNQWYIQSWNWLPIKKTISMLIHIFSGLKNNQGDKSETSDYVYCSHEINYYFLPLQFEFMILDTSVIKARYINLIANSQDHRNKNIPGTATWDLCLGVHVPLLLSRSFDKPKAGSKSLY